MRQNSEFLLEVINSDPQYNQLMWWMHWHLMVLGIASRHTGHTLKALAAACAAALHWGIYITLGKMWSSLLDFLYAPIPSMYEEF